MRLEQPRIPPLEPEQWDADVSRIMEPFVAAGSDHNVFRTIANHPDLMRRWLVFANHVLFKSTLPPRERELVILRIGFLCGAEYEWAQHRIIGLQAGLDEAAIESTRRGPSTPDLNELDRLLLTATDELHEDAFISEPTWTALSGHLDTRQLMDLVFAVGQYNLVSMALNTFGVQLDPGLRGWED
jgi:4-carboxymuconolactone decarboxylase